MELSIIYFFVNLRCEEEKNRNIKDLSQKPLSGYNGILLICLCLLARQFYFVKHHYLQMISYAFIPWQVHMYVRP